MIDTMLANGRLQPRHRGVYTVGHCAHTEFDRETDALLACGEHCLLSHHSGAALWRFRPRSVNRPIDVTIVGREGSRQHSGIRVHRSRTITAKDVRIERGLPVTSPARTFLDIAADLSPREREVALDEALATNIMRLSELIELLGRANGHTAAPPMRALVQQRTHSTLTRSAANERFLGLARAAELPPFETNVLLYGFEADFFWRAARVATEVDSFQWHNTRTAYHRDRKKARVFADHDILLTPITWELMDTEPFAIVARLSRQIAERTATRTRQDDAA
jgi:hypothetical protein